jgi:hypothetical protein
MRIKSLEHLDDYVTGTMSDDDAAGFEEELFEAAAKGDGSADEARWFERFRLLVELLAKGDFLVRGSTAEDVEALTKGGLRVHVVELVRDRVLPYEKRTDVDIVVTHVPVDVRDYESVEATIENPDGRVLHTFRDCMGDPKSGHLYAICAMPLANMAWGGGPRVGRITGVKRGETERKELALYRLEPVR